MLDLQKLRESSSQTFSKMFDIASCGDILEPHLLSPDEALFWRDVLDHSAVEKYFILWNSMKMPMTVFYPGNML